MSVSTVRKLDKIDLGGTLIDALNNASFDPGLSHMLGYGAGQALPNYATITEGQPMIRGSTPQIGKLLVTAGCALGGLDIVNAIMYVAASVTKPPGKAARASNLHEVITMPLAFGYTRSINLTHNQAGEAQFEICGIYDGSNAVWTAAGSSALVGNIAAAEYFGAGPVYINNTLVPGIKSISIDGGANVNKESSDSEIWASYVNVDQVESVVTIRTLQPVNTLTYGIAGTAISSSTRFYGRKFAAGGGRVADGTAEHLKGVIASGLVIPGATQGDGSKLLTDEFKIVCLGSSDSTTTPIAWSLAAIT